jgi:hypothetical protein
VPWPTPSLRGARLQTKPWVSQMNESPDLRGARLQTKPWVSQMHESL